MLAEEKLAEIVKRKEENTMHFTLQDILDLRLIDIYLSLAFALVAGAITAAIGIAHFALVAEKDMLRQIAKHSINK